MGGSSSRVLFSGKKHQQQSDVDLRSWQGLTSVLQLGKKNLASPLEYAHFRDLVLQYAQRGGDAHLRERIEEYITQFSLSNPKDIESPDERVSGGSSVDASDKQPSPEVKHHKSTEVKQDTSTPSTTTQPQQIFRGSSRRVMPHSFVQSSEERVSAQSIPVKTEVSEPAIDTDTAAQIHDVMLNVIHDVETHIKKESGEVEENASSAQTTPSSEAHEQKEKVSEAIQPSEVDELKEKLPKTVQTIVVDTKENQKEDVSTNVSVASPDLVAHNAPIVVKQDAPQSLDMYKTRIQEIKRLVHEEIGNPMALIDAHNEIGKKYMSALLRALKASGGGTDNVIEAMKELEEVTQELRNNRSKPNESVLETTPHVEIPEKEIVVSPTPLSPVIEDTPTEVVQAMYEAPQPEEVTVPTPPSSDVVQEEEPVPIQSASWTHKIDTEAGSNTDPSHNAAVPKNVESEDVQKSEEIPIEPTPQEEKRPDPESRPYNVPLSDISPPPLPPSPKPNIPIPRTLADIKDSKVAKRKSGEIQQMDLFTPSITSALHELLHDWSLFAGSGFLGIGPGGKDHPLYLRLSALPMNEVLSGRFEGSDPKITREIKQYVDAWRHEQAIAYVEYETFEHYLRRVIQKILKRQGIA